MRTQYYRVAGFSLIELVIVVVIIGVIGAIAVPKLNSAGENAAAAALDADLTVLQKAIDRYSTEHMGDNPSVDNFVEQLTQYTDMKGNVSTTKTQQHIYGPYLRSMPAVPVGPAKGKKTVGTTADNDVAWIYNPTTGEIQANAKDKNQLMGSFQAEGGRGGGIETMVESIE